MAVKLYDCKYGYVEKSEYNEQALQMIDEFSPTALKDTFWFSGINECGYVAFDYAKNYPSVLINNTYDYPIYSIHDRISVYDGGEIVCGEYL
jgi:hypothetical protein